MIATQIGVIKGIKSQHPVMAEMTYAHANVQRITVVLILITQLGE